MDRTRTLWAFTAAGAAAAGAIVTRGLLRRGWKAAWGRRPPDRPDDPDIPWRDALLWAAATGVAAGVSRVLARRGAVSAWRKVTGEWPPRRG